MAIPDDVDRFICRGQVNLDVEIELDKDRQNRPQQSPISARPARLSCILMAPLKQYLANAQAVHIPAAILLSCAVLHGALIRARTTGLEYRTLQYFIDHCVSKRRR